MSSSKILIFLMVASIILRLFLCFQPPEVLIPTVASDDMFYYLCIARSIAQGRGATADGENSTNGFHPLWALALVPLYWIFGDSDGMLQWSLVLLSVFSVISAWFIYKIARRACGDAPALLAAITWLFCPYPVLIALAGVEAPLFTLLLGAATYWYYVLRKNDSSADVLLWRWAILGILVGAAVLARIDGLLLTALIFIDSLLRRRPRSLPLYRRLAPSLLFAGTGFLVALPWFAWSYLRTGYLLQMSGKAIHHQQHFIFWVQNSATPSLAYARAWLGQVFANMQGGVQSVTVLCGLTPGLFYTILALIIGLAIVAGIVNPQRSRECIKKCAPLAFFFCYGLGMFLLYSAYLWYNQNWYYYSIFFVGCVLAACLFNLIDACIVHRLPRKGRMVVWGILFIFIVGFSLHQTFWWWNRGIRGWQIDGYRMALWVKDNIPKESRIGSFNSGLLAYYCPQTVINLDGVVNGAAYRAMTEGKSFSYIRKERINYIVETPRSLRFRAFLSGMDPPRGLKPVYSKATYPEAILREDPITVYKVLY